MKPATQWNIDPKDVGAIGGRRTKRPARPRSMGLIAGAAVTAVVSGALVQGVALPAFAATPPVFPENILVFPNRDFVSLSGYQQTRPGQTATITVRRGGVLTGEAQGTIALPTADATLPALEVNHPGGVCWGTGPGAPNVTPDIKPGDVVDVAFSGGGSDSTVTQSPAVTGFTHALGSTQVVVNGTLNALGGPNGIPGQLEQRTIQPAFTTTAVVKRDVRAVLGPVVPDTTGSYSSGMTVTATTFTATYNFTLASNADLMAQAAQGDMRANSWQTTDLAGNRQGMTLAEFGMSGGSMPGCSAQVPANTAPNAPANVGGTSGDASLTATWDAATTIPDGSPVTGYVVEVQAVGTASFLRSTVAAGVLSAPFTGLTNGTPYTIQVFATSAAGQGPAGSGGPVTPSPLPTTVPGAPTIAAATAGNGNATVRWTAPVGRVPDSYTVEATTGTTVTTVPVASGTATSTVVAGLTNGASYTFKVAAVNILGTGAMSAASNAVTPNAGPGAPTIGAATTALVVNAQAGQATAVARWTAPAGTVPAITGYTVQVINAAGTQVGALRTAGATATSLTITGLVGGVPVRFKARATNTLGTSLFSAPSNAVTPGTVPNAPVIGTAVAGAAAGAITATANWASPTATSGVGINAYVISALRMSATGAVLSTTTSVPVSGALRTFSMTLPLAGNYRFVVKARNALGLGIGSARSNLVAGR
jgi:hypothetical protein